MLSLTAAVLSLAIRVLVNETDSFFQWNLEQSLRGLVGLVLLFNIYAIYQQVALNRIRRKLTEQKIVAAQLEHLALVDPLTGLYNRRVFEKRLGEEIARRDLG
jgi:predicted signal transduction protein with EAL and GGDEF domain